MSVLSVASFFFSWFRVLMISSISFVAAGSVWAAELPADRLRSWEEYVRLTEARIGRELASGAAGFLVADFEGPGVGDAARRDLRAGELVMTEMETSGDDGEAVDVPGGMIHHWRGAVLIPGATLDEVLEGVMHPEVASAAQADVLETRVLARGPDWLELYLRLQRSKIVTATYNTEHRVDYVRHGAARASSRTIATRIRELADVGTPDEHEKAEGEDRGFLWRLNSYWRYEQVAEGVIVECESLTLSRSIPFLVAPLVRPIVTGVARESLDRTLTSLRERLQQRPPS